MEVAHKSTSVDVLPMLEVLKQRITLLSPGIISGLVCIIIMSCHHKLLATVILKAINGINLHDFMVFSVSFARWLVLILIHEKKWRK